MPFAPHNDINLAVSDAEERSHACMEKQLLFKKKNKTKNSRIQQQREHGGVSSVVIYECYTVLAVSILQPRFCVFYPTFTVTSTTVN